MKTPRICRVVSLALCIILLASFCAGCGHKQKANGHEATVTVYITNTGHKYHEDGCRYLSHSQIAVSLEDAKGRGYQPCKVCCPPQ